ncbi:MATE family efflux transporter [Mycoplasma mycoides]|uniref:Membrane protein n=1 Tax=Mycoplasma mycoides subsp. capri TaxID=40477 RepID=A0AB38GES9_MYCMC|nr:MATE family efflux transporter [Mycoplasma mycoides]ADH21477.1 putative membrane protein [synthetic Mycoplasma mycoides JCVI-syn1.0]ACU78728.1 putative membrane protein [Mycoplasma mycoides subsp. capri str. GM12]ACU79559.1 putative membrane protein [Mycoplasma mycoides subsp. capri str. GM12]SRX61748.1 membrane protein [Mycoplasma mycoides subsp. capri]SRX62205.1 membrane protein [Mycoplasma mycoides subsp. capri]
MSSTVNEKQQRARKLFGETPISKAIWIVAIPSLLASLMVGLYSFIDQIFILQFVPKYSNVFGNMNSEIMKYLDLSLHNLTTNDLFKSYNEMLDAYNQQAGMLNASKLTVINSNTIVSISTASFAPLTIFSNAIVYLVPVGSSIYYTKCIGKRLEKTGKNLWATMFWVCIMLSIFSSFLSFIAIWSGLIDKIAGVTQIDPNIASRANIDVLRLQDFYNAAHKLSVQWAKQYVYIYASATILNSLTLYLSYFIRSEGYNTYVMFCAIVANLINIGLDALFIIVFKMGVLGGVVATVIGWVFNTFAYIIYIVIKDHKQKTWLSIKSLFMFKFNKKLLGPIFLLGLGGFLRTFGIGFSFLVMNLLIANSQFAMPEYFQFYWAKGQPIVTLFLITIFGISDGARSLFSYNYTLRKFDRCKEVYLWTMIIALLYSIIVYIFVSLTANNIWVWILNVDSDKIQGTATFIRVISLRIIAVSLVVNSLLAFQGANDIDKTIFSSAFENFISFIIVIPVSYGIAYFVYKTSGNKEIANWIIVGAFVFNCLLASLVLMVFSYWFVFKKLEKIDQAKLSWSRKIEHKFFQRAQQDELLQVQTTN